MVVSRRQGYWHPCSGPIVLKGPQIRPREEYDQTRPMCIEGRTRVKDEARTKEAGSPWPISSLPERGYESVVKQMSYLSALMS